MMFVFTIFDRIDLILRSLVYIDQSFAMSMKFQP